MVACCLPDHSTCSKNRYGRFPQSDLLVFETVPQRCIRERCRT